MKEERPPPFYRESTRFTHKTRFELVIVSSNRESIKNKELGNHWGCPLSGCAIYYYIYLSLSLSSLRRTIRYKFLLSCFHCARTGTMTGLVRRSPVWAGWSYFQIEREKKTRSVCVSGVARPDDDTSKKINRSSPSEGESLLQQTWNTLPCMDVFFSLNFKFKFFFFSWVKEGTYLMPYAKKK